MKNIDLNETTAHGCGCGSVQEEPTAVAKTCACGPDCTCGCNDGKPCTCGGKACDCGPDCTCGCNDGKPCTCGHESAAGSAATGAASATYTVTGMTCGHCVKAVTDEVSAIPGVTGVDVDLATARLTVASDAPVDFDRIVEAVAEAGDYTVE